MKHPGLLRRLLHSWACMRAARHEFDPAAAPPPGLPKVSVMVITYNHERYIAQALDGILLQERDFDIEINVIDDASTDRTQEIVREYQRRHPGLVRCCFGETNLGHIATQLNTYRGFQTLRGQYFAILEGDDYWTDPAKLRTQIRFLDSHPRYVACAHDTLKVHEDGSRPPEHFLPFKAFGRRRAAIGDLIGLAGVFHLSSLVYRNVFAARPPLCLSDPYSCEATVNMVYGQFGDFHHIPGYMSVYRAHGTGVFSRQTIERMWMFHLHGFRRFALYLGPRYLYYFVRAIAGFSAFALSAWKRGEGPRLDARHRLLFRVHLAAAKSLFLALHPFFLLRVQARAIGRNLAGLLARWSGDRAPAADGELPPLLVRLLDSRAAFRALRSGQHAPPAAGAAPDAGTPRVSVILTTCNDATHVAQAIASVLAQVRDFDMEVNVVDDGSTDGTQRVVLDHAARHPGLIRCFLHEPADGEPSWQRHMHRALQTARGQYVALLSGSEYWCDRHKLARQVAFLDANPAYVGCSHETADEVDGVAAPVASSETGTRAGMDADIDALLRQSVVLHQSTLLYRNLFGRRPPACLADPFSSQAGMNVVYAQFGTFHRLPQIMSVERTPAAGAQPAALQVNVWLFQLCAFRRFALYLGRRHLHRFAEAVAGYCTYVLTAPQRGGPRLPPRARVVFRSHLLGARSLLPALRAAHRADAAVRSAHARIAAALAPGSIYRLLVRISPAWLLRTVVAVEMRWPRIQALRREWKQSADLQFHDKG
jgi:glycosyltransferase involved in cell wall biosynthesis